MDKIEKIIDLQKAKELGKGNSETHTSTELVICDCYDCWIERMKKKEINHGT